MPRGSIELREIHSIHHPRERGKNLRLWRDIACSDGLGTQKALFFACLMGVAVRDDALLRLSCMALMDIRLAHRFSRYLFTRFTAVASLGSCF